MRRLFFLVVVPVLFAFLCIICHSPKPVDETMSPEQQIKRPESHRHTDSHRSFDSIDEVEAALEVPVPAPTSLHGEDEDFLPALPPIEYFDDGSPDPTSGRAAALQVWALHNPELWDSMDQTLHDCVYNCYVNYFYTSPEKGLDDCLDFYESKSE